MSELVTSGNDILSVSYVGEPKSHTAVYIVKKIQNQLVNLYSVQDCLVFAEIGLEVPADLLAVHKFEFSMYPQCAYAQFANLIEQRRLAQESTLHYHLVDGAYISEAASIGKNVVIEPGCLIGHNVVIGDDSTVLARSVIKNAVVGNGFCCGEGAVVGSAAFTITEDETGHKLRIPALGRVRIGNNVEIGALSNIARGSAGDTVLENRAKIGGLVHVGHDAHVFEDVEIAAQCLIGGFAHIRKDAFVGVNACIRNRVTVGEKAYVGMGSVVTKTVKSTRKVFGNPAHRLDILDKCP